MENRSIKNLEVKIRILYPIWIVVAIFSVAYVPSLVFEQNDYLTTANNLHENEFLFRLSILGSFATAILMVYISFYLHLLFEKINKNKAKLMLILATISIPLTMGFDLFKIAALHLNEPEKIYVYLNLSKIGIHISSVMWGLWLFPLGTLVIESNWFPKVLGYLLLGSGIGYLVVSMLQILFPQFKTLLLIAESLTFGEVVFALWFIFKGLKLNNKEIRLQI